MAAPQIPNVNFTFPNNNLGAVPLSPGGIIAVIGACTHPDLDLDTPRTIGGSPENVVTVGGYGPAADLAANLVAGGATIVLVPCDYTPAVPSAVTHTGTGLSVMSVTGDPFDQYWVKVTVARSGTAQGADAPSITISLDNGMSTSGQIRLPANGIYTGLAATTGLTLNFTAATMVAGDTYEFTVGAPDVAAADVVTAMTALRQSTEAYSMIYVVGAFDETDTASLVDAAALFPPKKRFVRLFTEVTDGAGETESDWMADLQDSFEGILQSDLVVVSAGNDFVRSVVLNCLMWRSVGQLAAVRASQVAVSRDLAAVQDGALVPYQGASPVTKPTTLPDGLFVHDEDLNPGLNSAQFLTQRSFPGKAGYYVTNPNLFSGPTSDYNLLQLGRTADEIARLTNLYLTEQLSNDVLLNPQTGKMLASEVKKLEQGNNQACAAVVNAQNVSALATTIDPDANIINQEPIQVTVRWVPKGYLKGFEVSITVSRTL